MSTPWPRDEVEAALEQARATGDDAKTLRTLARAVLCLPVPPRDDDAGSPVVLTLEPGALPLPSVDTPYGPAVPVFSSWAELAVCSSPTVAASWMQVTTAGLLAQLGPEHRVVLNPGGTAEALLRPEHLQRLLRLVRREVTRDAVHCGPTSQLLFGAPAAPRTDLLSAVAAVARELPGVRTLHSGQAQVDEPDALPFVVLGVRLEQGREEAVVGALRSAASSVTPDHVAVHVLPDGASDRPLLRWLAQQPDLLDLP